jgi:hypothetical protein
MKRLRHRRLRARLSILAIVALLWSQIVLAGHPACSLAAMALAEVADVATADAGHDCHPPAPSPDSTLCLAHCSQSDQSSDIGRIPPVPPSTPAPALGIVTVLLLGPDPAPGVELPPPVSWHRPTRHPASLLLI